MSRPSATDHLRLARNAAETAARFQRDGAAAFRRYSEWSAGVRSPNLQPHQARYDEAGYYLPNDPTGDSATNPDQLAGCNDEWLHAVNQYEHARAHLETLLRRAVPVPATADEDDGEGGCVSCKTDAGYFEPVEHGVSKTLCRWCRSFRSAEGRLPPVELLRARHRGVRITRQLVDVVLRRKPA